MRIIVWSILCVVVLLATFGKADDRSLRRNTRRQNVRDPSNAVSFVRSGERRKRPKPNTPHDRNGKLLNVFTVIQFPNGACAAASGENGTCLTPSECSERGGVASGLCASGYGVCCVFLATCGQTIRENCTYFVNNGYPSAYDATGSCQLTIIKNHPDVCQYRLDFEQFQLAGPGMTSHQCNNDQFIVSGGNPVTPICGMNTGNHMYIDAGQGDTNPVTLTVVTSGPSFPRNFKIKVCQIPCSSTYRAPFGCLQYFTGVSGQIKSFNYDPGSGLHLSNQDYTTCIRMERNFCGIGYTSCPDTVNNRTQSFTLSGDTRTAVVASRVGNECPRDYLFVPCATNLSNRTIACQDRLCGGTLNAISGSTTPTTIYSSVKPFRLGFRSDNVEGPDDVGNRGFCLNYVQQPCTNMLL